MRSSHDKPILLISKVFSFRVVSSLYSGGVDDVTTFVHSINWPLGEGFIKENYAWANKVFQQERNI